MKSTSPVLPEFMERMLPCPRGGGADGDCDEMPLSAMMMAHICLLNSVLERAGDRQTAQHGLTMTQWFALGCVGHAGAVGVTHSELGTRLMLSKAPITGVVDRLERGGFVYREADAHDRRVSRVKITELGSQKWQEVRDSLRELAERICAGISEQEMMTTQKVLAQLMEGASKADPAGAGE